MPSWPYNPPSSKDRRTGRSGTDPRSAAWSIDRFGVPRVSDRFKLLGLHRAFPVLCIVRAKPSLLGFNEELNQAGHERMRCDRGPGGQCWCTSDPGQISKIRELCGFGDVTNNPETPMVLRSLVVVLGLLLGHIQAMAIGLAQSILELNVVAPGLAPEGSRDSQSLSGGICSRTRSVPEAIGSGYLTLRNGQIGNDSGYLRKVRSTR